MDDEHKRLEKLFEDLCEDMVNIARVLPNLTPLDLQTELLELRNDPDRVAIIIKKHFKYYNEERENTMSQDIKMIKRVVPRTPIVQISKDIFEFGQRRNRVQLVLKKYFSSVGDDAQKSNMHKKRLLDDEDEVANKMMKIDENINTLDHLIPDRNNDDVPSTSKIVDNLVYTKNDDSLEETVSSSIEPEAEPEPEPETGNSNTIPEETSQNSAEPAELTELTEQMEETEIENSIEEEKPEIAEIPEFAELAENSEEPKSCVQENNTSDNKTNTLLYHINRLYPDLAEEEVLGILSSLNIDIYAPADDMTLNLVLNEIINHFEAKEKVETKPDDDKNNSVKTNTQSTESSSTEDYDVKEELTNYFTEADEQSVVKQEPDYSPESLNFTDRNLGLIREICQGIDEDNAKTTEDNPFIRIATGTDNWVKSALNQAKNTTLDACITSTSEFDLYKDIIKPAKIEKRKRAVSSTVTSASISGNATLVEPPRPQPTTTNVNFINYAVDLEHRTPPKRYRETENLWSTPLRPNHNPNHVGVIERPPRDNLKSSLNNRFTGAGAGGSGAGVVEAVSHHSRNLLNPLPTYGKNFVQYLETRNNLERNDNVDEIIGITEERLDAIFTPIAHPHTHTHAHTHTNANTNHNFVEDKVVEMPRRRSLLAEQEDRVKAMLCELDNIYCRGCKKCRKNTMAALKVRNDLFPHDDDSPESMDADDEDVEMVGRMKQTIPIVDLSESSSSNPLPGTSGTLQPNENHPFYYKIMEMFPDICPEYLRNLCNGKDQSSKCFDHLISNLLEGNYKQRERVNSPSPALDFEEQYKMLLELFPDADPTYLQHHCERLFEHPNEFKEFVASLIEHRNYPTKEEYLQKLKLSAQQKQYTTEFDVKKFLEVIPNPEEFFKNHFVKRNFYDQDYAFTFLKNHYCHLSIKDINMAFRDCNFSIVATSTLLDKIKRNLKSKRKPYPLTNCTNIPLLQEIAYVKHKTEILNYVKEQEQEKIKKRESAKAAGLLKTCECCYDDEVMPEDMACCENHHVFCKECVKKGCEVKIGEGKLDFPCLTTCDAKFTLQVLQSVLTPKVFSKMAQRKQLEEVKSAGIEELEFCPFCDFATIPAPGDKLFRCLNPDCMKETCRECKEPSHIPLRCDEVEKENDVKLRTYIEDKMTEALVRKCYKCGMKFIKEEGCNKMTCSCGAMMCYVCNQPVKDYKHFNGQGGDQYHLCPLYSDTHKLHMDAVKLSAENAKKELGIANNQLKIDPTANLDQHYKRLATRNPQNLPPGMEQLNPQRIHIRIQEFHLARR